MCRKCNKREVIKDGIRNKKQSYKCKHCGYVFCNNNKKQSTKRLWNSYCKGKQTYEQLAKAKKTNIWNIRRQLDKASISSKKLLPGKTVLVIDTTYFDERIALTVLRCWKRKKNIYWRFVDYERNNHYIEGVKVLQKEGWEIEGIVCDGRRGLFKASGTLPVQMCIFHQVMIITRYLTKKPKLPAHIELRKIALRLKETDKASFTYWLEEWHQKWKEYLSDFFVDRRGKKHYRHRRLRSAYRSLKYNLPYLFAWEDNFELDMPNTTNSIDGFFSHLKDKVRVHRGLKKHRKMKLISELL